MTLCQHIRNNNNDRISIIEFLFLSDNTCELLSKTDYLYNGANNCRSTEKIIINYCSGSCGDSSSSPILLHEKINYLQSQCKCCHGKVEKIHAIPALCGDNQELKANLYYAEVCSCECQVCK